MGCPVVTSGLRQLELVERPDECIGRIAGARDHELIAGTGHGDEELAERAILVLSPFVH